MDGVLFLSSDCHGRAFEETLANDGIKDFSYASVAGMRTDEAFEKIFAENGRALDASHLKELVDAKRRNALDLLAEEGKVAPGSAKLLLELKKRYRLALASSASPQTVELFLRKSGYADLFEFCLNGSAVVKSKPDPEIYLLAAQKLGLGPKQCAVVEDAVSGVQAAMNANIPVVALVEAGREKEFAQLRPVGMVSCLTDIEPLFL